MSSSFYDILICGTELPGLILGALCAKKGYRVLIIGQGCRPSRYTHGAYEFQRRPFMLTGMEDSPAVRQVLGELSLSLEMRNRPRKSEPSYQVVMPRHRLNVSSDRDRFAIELDREFPGEGRLVESFRGQLDQLNARISSLLQLHPPLPPDGWSERREFLRAVEDFPDLAGTAPLDDPMAAFPPGHPFRASVLAPILATSTMDLEGGPTIPRARSVAHVLSGAYRVEGGLDAYKEFFTARLRQHASDFRPEIALDRLEMKRGKVVEGYVRDRRESIGCNLIVCNSELKRFFKLVPPEHQKERWHHRIHSLQPSHYLFTVNLALSANGLPEGIADDVFIVAGTGKRLVDEDLIFLQLHRPADSAAKGAGGEPPTILATATCRPRARGISPSMSYVSELTHRILVRLRESVFPFLDEHLLAVHCPWVVADPMTGEQRFDASEMIPVYGTSSEQTLGASVLPVQTDYKNILVCAEPTFSGFGVEGAFLAALNAYQRVTERVVLKTLIG